MGYQTVVRDQSWGKFHLLGLRAIDGEHRGNRACVPPSNSWKNPFSIKSQANRRRPDR